MSSEVLLISLLLQSIRVFFLPLLLLLTVVALVFVLLPAALSPKVFPFPGVSMQFSSHIGAEGLGVNLSLSHLTLYLKRTEYFPLLPRECKALPPKIGLFLVREGVQRLSHSPAWVRALLVPQKKEVFPWFFILTALIPAAARLGSCQW